MQTSLPPSQRKRANVFVRPRHPPGGLLRSDATNGYPAQEFTSLGCELHRIWLTERWNSNDSAGIKGGLLAGPPFFSPFFLAFPASVTATVRRPLPAIVLNSQAWVTRPIIRPRDTCAVRP